MSDAEQLEHLQALLARQDSGAAPFEDGATVAVTVVSVCEHVLAVGGSTERPERTKLPRQRPR